jgi:hypothetical protein
VNSPARRTRTSRLPDLAIDRTELARELATLAHADACRCPRPADRDVRQRRAAHCSIDRPALVRDLVPELVEEILPRVLAGIAARMIAPGRPTAYSTRKGHGPEGLSERRWKAVAPTIPGYVRRGRWGFVSHEDFEQWERSRSTAPAATKPSNDVARSTWTPAQAMAECGLRRER